MRARDECFMKEMQNQNISITIQTMCNKTNANVNDDAMMMQRCDDDECAKPLIFAKDERDDDMQNENQR